MVSHAYGLPAPMIRHRGFFDPDTLIKKLESWFFENDYATPNIPDLRTKPSLLGHGTDYSFKIKADRKVTEYVKFHMEVWLRIWSAQSVEIIQDGKKIKTTEGMVQIEINPKIEFDWQNRFGGSKLLIWLGGIVENRILKYKVGDYWEDILIANAVQLSKMLKDTLGQEVP